MDLLPTDLLPARRALYDLLARLYLRPPDADLLDTLRALPGIAGHVPADSNAIEMLQVEYEFVFGRNVYPYESLYVDRDLLLNTAAADQVARLYAACTFTAGASEAGAPDHLGLELRLMGHLLAVEIAARGDNNQAALDWSRAQQGRCLHEHLARWTPVCLRAIERVATHAFYRTIAQLTLELVLGDAAHLAPPAPAIILLELRRPPAIASPDPGQPADEEAWGIDRVVRRLITPDEVGIFLSRSDLGMIGRRLGLPAPIGERFQMLRGLFETAGQFDLVSPLLATLDEMLAGEAAELHSLVGMYPAWAGSARHWLHRLAQGRALLAELRTQAQTCTGADGQ